MKDLIGELMEIEAEFTGGARNLRTTDTGLSYRMFLIAETCRKAAEELKKRIPLEMEIEGGGSSWWYVCPECHGAIDKADHFCRHCGQAVKDK